MMVFISSLRVLSDSRLCFHKFVPSNKVSIRKMYSLKIIFQASERDEICENISPCTLDRMPSLAAPAWLLCWLMTLGIRPQLAALSIQSCTAHCSSTGGLRANVDMHSICN